MKTQTKKESKTPSCNKKLAHCKYPPFNDKTSYCQQPFLTVLNHHVYTHRFSFFLAFPLLKLNFTAVVI
jgi:hypothetical protein